MGGFATAVKDVVADPAVRADAAQAFKKAFRPMENYFSDTDIGKSLLNDLHEYSRKSSTNLQDLLNQENQKPAHLRTDPKELHSQASKLASTQVFGKNHARITAHVVAAQAQHGLPYSKGLQDHVAMFLKDTTDIDALSASQQAAKFKYGAKIKKGSTATQQVSLSKYNFINNAEVNPAGHDIRPVYTPPGSAERRLHDYINVVAAPFIAIPHIGTIFNNTLSGGFPEMAKALTEVIPGTDSYKKWHDTLSTAGIFSDTAFRSYSDLIQYKSGNLSKLLGSDVAYYLNKAIHQPGFNALRDWQLTFTGATAKLSAIKYAQDFVQSGSKRAESELRDTMGLSLTDIKAQGGKLNPDQIEKAIYNYVDKKIFLNNTLRRSYYSGANPYMRTALMYHGYVAAQGQLIKKEFMKAIRSGNIGKMAQFFAVAGVVFPVVGEGVKQLERYARGQDWGNEDGNQLEKDLDSMSNYKDHPFEAAFTYADAYAHMAGFGVAASYTSSAARNQLASTVVGPGPNMMLKLGTDIAKPLYEESKKSDKGEDLTAEPFKPLGRDALEMSLPLNLGKIATHRLLPTKAEQESRGEIEHKKLKKLSMKGLKKLD